MRFATFLAVVATAAAVTLLASYGDDDDDEPSTQDPVDADVKAAVHVLDPDKPLPYEKQISAKPRDTVQLRVTLAESEGERVEGAGVRIRVPAKRARVLRLAVGPVEGRPADEARITAAGEGQIRLVEGRYACRLPPETFCPFDSVDVTDDAYEIVGSAPTAAVPIVLSFDVK
jgi:hypothetical protein